MKNKILLLLLVGVLLVGILPNINATFLNSSDVSGLISYHYWNNYSDILHLLDFKANQGTPTFGTVGCKSGSCVTITADTNNVISNQSTSIFNLGNSGNKTFNFWADWTTGDYIISYLDWYINHQAGPDRWYYGWSTLGTGGNMVGMDMVTIVQNQSGTFAYLNGVLDRSGSFATNATSGSTFRIGTSGTNNSGTTLLFDDLAVWNRTLSGAEILGIYNAGAGKFYDNSTGGGFVAGVPNVNLIYPLNRSSIYINWINFSSNYTGSNLKNFTNATYYVWNSTGVFNSTKVDVNNAINLTSLNITGFLLDSYKWNVYACAYNQTNDSVCSWGSYGNFTFQVEGSIVNESYNNLTYETQSEKFQANFSLFPGTNMISVYLVYNGTSYVVSDITNYGTIVELKRTIDIPVNPDPYKSYNNTWFWSFTFSNGGLTNQNTTLRNQTVNPLNIVFCNATYLQGGINFTTYDETNPNPLILSTFHTFWSFWSGSGTIKKNYSYEDTSITKSSFKFCIHPNQSIIKTNLDTEITSPGFFPRTYYLRNATINNVTQEVPIRMINDTLGVKFFHTIRKGVSRISNAIVIISKFDVGLGLWVVVGIRQSGGDGEFVEYLELDKDYTYSITQNGIFLGNIEKNTVCSATPCLVNLDIETDSGNLWNGYYDAYAPNVVYNLSYNKTSHNVTYTFVDTSGLATYFRLQVNKVSANESGALICDKSLYATVGTLTCDLTGETGGFVAKGFVSRSPEKLVAVLYGILNALTEIIGKNEGLFFTLLIVVVVGMIGAFNPVIGVLLAGLAFIFSAIMGFVMISVTAIILVTILIIILIVKMGRQGV